MVGDAPGSEPVKWTAQFGLLWAALADRSTALRMLGGDACMPRAHPNLLGLFYEFTKTFLAIRFGVDLAGALEWFDFDAG